MEDACRGRPGISIERREGYLVVTIELDTDPPGLSERARALLSAFPPADGRRTLRVDVRNRHWAARVIEIARAAGGGSVSGR